MSSLTEIRRGMFAAKARRERITWLVVAVLVCLFPLTISSGFAFAISIQIGISIIFALSYNMMLGQGGMLSFGHAVYFGLGGFMAMHFMNFIGDEMLWLPVPLLPLVGGAFGLLLGLFIGSFSTRRAGTVFAMISMGIGELVAACSLIFVAFFGGEEGISSDRTMGPVFFEFDLAQDVQVYYVVAFWMLLAAFAMYHFSRSPAGRMANAVRDNPERAEFVGYSQRYVRLITFCAAGLFAGIAGSLFAITYEILTEETVNATTSGGVLLQAYIGGIGAFPGPIVGAILMTMLSTVLPNYTELWLLYLGIMFVFIVMFLPMGLTGLVTMHFRAHQLGRLNTLVKPYLTMVLPSLMMLIGLVGILEMAHHWQNAAVGETEVHIFFTVLNFTNPVHWALFVVMFVGGISIIRKLKSSVIDAWGLANVEVLPTAQNDEQSTTENAQGGSQ